MKVNSIIEKKSKQVKASEKKPKLNKPNLGHESPHPMQGRMVGESLIEVFFKYANNTNIQLTEQELQLIQEAPGDIRKFLAILTIMGGLGYGFGKMLDATSFKHSELGMELKAAADQGDEVAAYHYKNLDAYADLNDQRTIINLRIHYLDDSPRDDVKARLAKQANKDDDYKTIQQPDRQNRKNESKEIKRSNPVAKHSRNMSGAGAHKDKKKELKKGVVKHKGKELEEGGYSASKSALVKAVLNDLEKKALSDDVDNLTFLNKLARMIGKKVYKRENGSLVMENPIPFTQCPKCKGSIVHETQLNEKQDACYHKVKSRYKVWPSAYASGALVKCRKVGAKNWGNSSKKKKKKSKK